MEIGDYLAAVRRRWWLMAVLAVLGAAAGYQQAASTTPAYRSTATVYVSLSRGDTVTELVQGSTYTRNLVESYVRLARQPYVLQPVIDDLGLDVTPARLAGSVTTEAPLDSMLIEISASSASPERAARIANAVAAQLGKAVADLSPASQDGLATVQVTTVGPATPAAWAYTPNTKLLVMTGGGAGLALGLVLALAWLRLDTRVRTVDDLRGRTVLGSVPRDRAFRHDGPLTVVTSPRGPIAEAYRRVRANLDFLDSATRVRTVVVTSTLPGDGKSTTSASLALALAHTGRRVLLVDADLRRPALARMCGLEESAGLTTVLTHRATLEDVRQPWGSDGLDVLTSGPVPPNPTQLIDSQAMADFLRDAQDRYDVVIVDTSPLLAVTDAAVLARRASGAIVVARARRVRRKDLAEALATLDGLGATCLGVVLNAGPRTPHASSYGYVEQGRRRRGIRRAGPAPVAPPTASAASAEPATSAVSTATWLPPAEEETRALPIVAARANPPGPVPSGSTTGSTSPGTPVVEGSEGTPGAPRREAPPLRP